MPLRAAFAPTGAFASQRFQVCFNFPAIHKIQPSLTLVYIFSK
ncbi:hypothetical protein E0E46_01705 [Gardnerella vaginalis ATCC 14018 = JCM 11026]|uniref:Uncharacterized protein n=1 Tax=Gardnerella vaginalis (strain ATCC 14019 / 317) TaxID=525284 RepID=E3D7E3_GARV3|nr:hypothetical protein HMPREF0421_20088 [Gardnerella vaginalis ATCC 14019]TCH80883.1 hypothetical protein E0E48_03500 [Gardnerella vaginalis]TCH82895.1 hypothetical protein E0E46_01705 [Gardnerella vaginalis ATCC 14018 = JCM 11026]